jgi:hypothetical protein
MRRLTREALLLAALTLAISGCESSQDRSAQLKKAGQGVIANQRGLVISERNSDVRVVHTGVITDPNGTAAAIVLRNVKPTTLASLPIAITVLGPGGKSVFRNNSPGLQPSLVSVAALPARGEITWVNDQVIPTGKAIAVHAEVGAGGSGAPASLPRIDVGAPRLSNDPSSGLEASGRITNPSSVVQLKLFVYVSAWRAGRLVSAGRGAIARLAAHAHTTYHVFLIGNPQGARLTVVAPPTVLR